MQLLLLLFFLLPNGCATCYSTQLTTRFLLASCVQIAAGEVEKAVEEALMQEVERKQQQLGTGSAAAAPGFAGPQASSHVQNVF